MRRPYDNENSSRNVARSRRAAGAPRETPCAAPTITKIAVETSPEAGEPPALAGPCMASPLRSYCLYLIEQP